MITLITCLVVVLATGPLTYWGVRIARKNRRLAYAAASLLLLMGVNISVDPPPPPRIEAAEPEDEEARNDEPK